jgi:hypothetical protein
VDQEEAMNIEGLKLNLKSLFEARTREDAILLLQEASAQLAILNRHLAKIIEKGLAE